jgi:predicted kinase
VSRRFGICDLFCDKKINQKEFQMIVIVFGLPGAGKSYFASRLAQKLRAQYLSSDEIRIATKARGKYTFSDKLAVYQRMAEESDKALLNGKDVIVDGTFYHHNMRDLFTSLAAIRSTPIYFIETTAGDEIIKDRLMKHRTESEADYEVYQQLKKQFEQLDLPHLRIESCRNNISEMLSQAENYLLQQNHE